MSDESSTRRNHALDFLDELDERHDFLLDELEQLNARIDTVLSEYTKSRQTAALGVDGPSELTTSESTNKVDPPYDAADASNFIVEAADFD